MTQIVGANYCHVVEVTTTMIHSQFDPLHDHRECDLNDTDAAEHVPGVEGA